MIHNTHTHTHTHTSKKIMTDSRWVLPVQFANYLWCYRRETEFVVAVSMASVSPFGRKSSPRVLTECSGGTDTCFPVGTHE